MKKRLLAALLACILCFALLPQVALAAKTIELDIGKGNITIGNNSGVTGWDKNGTAYSGSYTPGTDTIVITGTTDTNRIEVNTTDPVTITLKDVNIDVSKIDYAAALLLHSGANVKLRLEGESVLKSGKYCAGIEAPEGTTLTIEGSGKLQAYGGQSPMLFGGGAGIGGGWLGNGGTITIQGSANVTATGGEFAAGIGGGFQGNGGEITIAGSAEVNATGGIFGAGIGGGYGGDGGEITIADSATVTGNGGDGGAGIGGGGNGGNGGEITIADSATVRAFGGDYGAGIGGGAGGNGGTITIQGSANVTAQGGEGGAGIGGGNEGNGEEITIQPGARVAAMGGNGEYRSGSGASGDGGGAGIGGGGGWGGYPSPDQMRGGKPGRISLPEGRRGVTATGGTGGAGGNIKAGDGADIGYGGDGANDESEENRIGKDGAPAEDITYLPFPRRMVPTYTVDVTCLGPGASNIKAPREVDAGSILRVKLYPEEGAALLALTVNGQTYDPALLKVEGEALIYGINRIDEDYELVAEFGEPVLAGVPEVEVTDPPKTGDAAASGGFFMLLVLAFGVALWRARRGRAKN